MSPTTNRENETTIQSATKNIAKADKNTERLVHAANDSESVTHLPRKDPMVRRTPISYSQDDVDELKNKSMIFFAQQQSEKMARSKNHEQTIYVKNHQLVALSSLQQH